MARNSIYHIRDEPDPGRFYHSLLQRGWNRKRGTNLRDRFELQIRGWKGGIEVHGFPDLTNGVDDHFSVYITGGSNAPGMRVHALDVIVDHETGALRVTVDEVVKNWENT